MNPQVVAVKPGPIHIEKHTPERRRQPTVTVACGCSCSCCCCCLHSVGGVVGAALAPVLVRRARPPITQHYDPEVRGLVPKVSKEGVSALALFWWIFLGLCVLAFPIGAALSYGDTAVGVMVTIVVLLLIMPALQLVSLFISLVAVALMNRPDRRYQLTQVGKAGLGLIVGTVVGILVMVGIGMLIAGAGKVR
jgi:hypothetical protein